MGLASSPGSSRFSNVATLENREEPGDEAIMGPQFIAMLRLTGVHIVNCPVRASALAVESTACSSGHSHHL